MLDLGEYEEAPLVRPNGRPLPEGLRIGERSRAFFLRHPHKRGEVRLRCFLAWPEGEPRGSIILHPGRTEFIEKYFETIEDLSSRGFVVMAMDPRGQGLSDRLQSDGLKSYVGRYLHYAEDVGWVQEHFADRLPRPHILLGHSMGGLTVLQAVIEKRAEPDAVIASAPMLGLWDIATPLPRYLFRAFDTLGLGSRDLPFQKQERGIPIDFEGNKLTSDPVRFRAWREYFLSTPELRVAGPTVRWIAEGLRAMAKTMRRAERLDVPTLLFAPGADPIVDPASIRDFARRSGADVVTVAGAKHELFLEQDEYRDQFFEALDAWLEERGI